MSIIAWILIGLIAGAVARKLMPGRISGGWIVTLLLGIAGALLGGWLGKVIFGVETIEGFFTLSTWIAAIVGACLLLFLYGALMGRQRA